LELYRVNGGDSPLQLVHNSGKRNPVLAILRMLEVQSGRILLDDVDWSTIKGSVIRERHIWLTQKPFLLPGLLRTNTDLSNRSEDGAIINALQKVDLWSVLVRKAAEIAAEDVTTADLNTLTALDVNLNEELLPHGQRQLFCLAESMLKACKALILDETISRYVHGSSFYGLIPT
jgi:ATP-binding cassette, subfamily C (CFTR/MRP), member 1